MKTHLRRALAALLSLALSLTLTLPALAADPAAAPASPAAEEQPAQTLSGVSASAAAGAMTYGGAAQINWAVWRDGEIIEKGIQGGVVDDSELSHLQALAAAFPGLEYGIGSVSKIFTTVAVMQLAEAGKLSLDQPVTKYLPDFKMADPRYRQITVRMLLNHSSGLMGSSMGSGLLFNDGSEAAADQLLERLSTQRLKADPGAYSVYCNDGFTLAQLVVEAAGGQDFMDYLTAHILKPAGLEHTYAPGGSFDPAAIYDAASGRALPKDCLGTLGTGGLYATAEDLASFGGALTGTKLLKKASLEAMAQPEYRKGLWPEEDAPDALSYGLGWDSVEWFPFRQNGITALVKGGDTQYYHAGLVVLPEHHMAAAVLTSGGVSTYNELAATRMLVAALREQGVEIDETAPALPESAPARMPGNLAKYAGYYGGVLQYRIDVTAGGKLTLQALGMEAPAQEFTYCADGSFRDKAGTALLKFVEKNGRTYLYQRAFSEIPGLGGLGTSNFAAEKLPENKAGAAAQAAWDETLTVDVLPMNERYSSQVYLAMTAAAAAQAAQTGGSESAPGYIGGLRIVDGTHAQYALQIPGTAGRDGSDLELRRDADGTLWLYQSSGTVYMEQSAAPELWTGTGRARCTIQPDGFARWYRIGAAAAGKSLKADMPEDAGYWVYDKDWNVTASSVLGVQGPVELPEGGMIVFAGDPGARFEMTFS